jgi:hypothetical protein
MRVVLGAQRWDNVNRMVQNADELLLYKRLDPSYQFGQRNISVTDSDIRDDAAGINRDTAVNDWPVNSGPGDLIATLSLATIAAEADEGNYLQVIDGGN